MSARLLVRSSCVAVLLGGLWLALACNEAASCPGHPCAPASDGIPFDVLDWCQTTGQCLRDGILVPICPHADASPAPSCALGPVGAGETLSFPIGSIASTLGGRRDLVVVYAQCDMDAEPADLEDVQVLYDGAPASCAATNPCNPGAAPTVVTCAEVPSTVELLTLSFSYGGAMGKTALRVVMQNTTCSYFCG
jgi:hypothetical protein